MAWRSLCELETIPLKRWLLKHQKQRAAVNLNSLKRSVSFRAMGFVCELLEGRPVAQLEATCTAISGRLSPSPLFAADLSRWPIHFSFLSFTSPLSFFLLLFNSVTRDRSFFVFFFWLLESRYRNQQLAAVDDNDLAFPVRNPLNIYSHWRGSAGAM